VMTWLALSLGKPPLSFAFSDILSEEYHYISDALFTHV